MAWNLENSVALGREGTGLAQVMKQPTLKELTTSPYEALARKKAALKKDLSPYNLGDISAEGIYENDIPEFAQRVKDWTNNTAKLKYDVANQLITDADALKKLQDYQKEKIQIQFDIQKSKQDNANINSIQQKINANPYDYDEDAITAFDAYKGNAFTTRAESNYSLPTNKFDWTKYWEGQLGTTYGVTAKGYRGSKGEGYREGETYFDENKAKENYNTAVTTQPESKINRWYHKAADEAEKDFAKNSKLQSQYNTNSWTGLTDAEKQTLTESKAEEMAVDLARSNFKKNKSRYDYEAREKDGDGGGSAGGKGVASYYPTTSIDDKGDITVTEYWTVPKPKTGSDTRLSKAIFYDASGKLMDDFVEPTGNFKRVEGKDQAEIAVNIYEDLYGTKVKSTTWIPLTAQNKTVLEARGYKKLSEVADETKRKSSVEGAAPMSPENWAKTLNTDGTKRSDQQVKNYKGRYDLWKSKGAKKKTYTGRKDQLTEFKGNKKAGTFDPTSGTINWA